MEEREERTISAYSLEEMFKLIIQWEKRLDSFYDLMEEYLIDVRSRTAAFALQERQRLALEALNAVYINDYKGAGNIPSVPDFHSEDLVPHFEINAQSSPKEVYQTIVGYELKLEAYYQHLLDVIVHEKSKEMFKMLLGHKIEQIKGIQDLMENYDLAK